MLSSGRRRLLYCSSVVPKQTGAGELLVYRHLADLRNWDLLIVGPDRNVPDAVFGQQVEIGISTAMRWLGRLRRGIAWPLVEKVLGYRLTASFAKTADAFQPQAVVSVMLPDAYLTAAAHYARQRDIPLLLFCHDDYEEDVPFGGREHFGQIYRQASVRFCVSKVMEREFARRYGVPGQVLPPIPGQMPKAPRPQNDSTPVTIGFAGSVDPGYEQALRSLADVVGQTGGRVVVASRTLRSIAPGIWNHPSIDDLGPLDPREVENTLLAAGVNVLAVVQSFDPAASRIKFNFPSKLTEYMTFGLPVVIIAPEYASAARWFVEERVDAAILITQPDVAAVAEALARLNKAVERRELADRIGELGRLYSHDGLSRQFEQSLLEAIGDVRLFVNASTAKDRPWT